MNFFEILYAQKNGAALPANFFDLLFAKSFTPATEWGEYDGTLPATYSANGSMLADYRVYGSAGGAGNRTENLYDITTQIPVSVNSNKSGYIHVEAGTTYTMWHDKTDNIERALQICDSSKAVIAQVPITPRVNSFTFNTNNSAAYVVIIYPAKSTQVMFVEGSTAPSEYIPYGYEVDMSVSDGTTSITTPIYIGSDPLGDDEYVSFKEQKIYRMSGGVLTPTDPPVPLPALPTVDGTNVVDYAGQSAAPSRFYAKYQKG